MGTEGYLTGQDEMQQSISETEHFRDKNRSLHINIEQPKAAGTLAENLTIFQKPTLSTQETRLTRDRNPVAAKQVETMKLDAKQLRI